MNNLEQINIKPVEIVDFLKKEISLKNIYKKILYQRMIERTAGERGITVTPEEIQAESDRFRTENRLEKAADTLAWLEDSMISPEDWEAGIRDRLLAKKLSQALFEKEAEKSFIENKVDFERILLYQIIVPYEKVARELFYQIEEQEISFYEAARLYDIDERRRLKCGYEGKILRSALKPDIAALVFRGHVGEVTGPIQSEQGYHLFLVEEFIGAELTPERRQNMISNLFKQWLEKEMIYFIHNQAEKTESTKIDES
ncbi:peptidylprolyl isomerase [Oscillatoria acuminata]|uniref:peptidylprolyl isomerase n=1 Tax=Oscillatoria acuminata PCC 6304 TaxID=56110 RepID=K9TCL3_9CYAN|nr:peptidylprolyl isomerase [Oscillatoria acuminata]AFY79851.1 parvulin-like peptidyl-prolyl isomerase [Oscillatoria acuminata PCC 6304]